MLEGAVRLETTHWLSLPVAGNVRSLALRVREEGEREEEREGTGERGGEKEERVVGREERWEGRGRRGEEGKERGKRERGGRRERCMLTCYL